MVQKLGRPAAHHEPGNREKREKRGGSFSLLQTLRLDGLIRKEGKGDERGADQKNIKRGRASVSAGEKQK